MTLDKAKELRPYKIKSIDTEDEKVKEFLLSLGFVSGETVEVIIKQRHGVVVLIKECRYSLDKNIASTIIV